ncbi:dephospho-CoA kinase domain-containing protein isoform X1 [Saimiri boliviensis]
MGMMIVSILSTVRAEIILQSALRTWQVESAHDHHYQSCTSSEWPSLNLKLGPCSFAPLFSLSFPGPGKGKVTAPGPGLGTSVPRSWPTSPRPPGRPRPAHLSGSRPPAPVPPSRWPDVLSACARSRGPASRAEPPCKRRGDWARGGGLGPVGGAGDSSAPGSAVSGQLFPGKMFLVGLTGGIASGKSSVIQVFQQLGCAVIDVDVMARHVVQPGYPAHRRIVEVFGTEVLLENGDINRKVLGDLIFNQPDRRQLLNAITHPEIRKEMMKETFKYFLRGYRYVILDIPLLFETKKLLKYMKHTVVVYCDRDTQLVRLMRRNNLNREDAEARINAQLPLTEKARMARHVLDNSGEWSVTKRQVVLLHAELERSLEYLPLRLGVLTGLAGIAILLYLLTHYLLPYA